MAEWVYFVFIASGIWAFTSLIDKFVISKGHIKNPLVYIVLNGLMNLLLVFLLPFAWFEPLKFTDFMIVLLSGAAYAAAVAVYYKAVQHDDISKIIILNQLTPIFVLALSFLFLGEMLAKNDFIGFLLLLAAGIMVSYKKTESSLKLSRAFYYMLLSAFLGAIGLAAAKHVFSITGFWSAFLWLRLAAFSALFVLLIPAIRGQFAETFKNMKPRIRGLLGLKIAVDFSAFIFLSYAILNGPISLVSVLVSSLLPLFVFLLVLLTSAYLPKIIKEEIDSKAVLTKLSAIALVIAGIVFISL